MVCTGNICRSPMAAGLLSRKLAEVGADATVVSAGLLVDGRPASDHGVTAMRRRGIDIVDHRSQRVSRELVERADLIVAMERRHVREVAVLDSAAFARTFTLPELARRAQVGGPRSADESVEEWLDWIGAGRRPTDLLSESAEDEIADPIGRSAREYEKTAVELEALVDVVVDHLIPKE